MVRFLWIVWCALACCARADDTPTLQKIFDDAKPRATITISAGDYLLKSPLRWLDKQVSIDARGVNIAYQGSGPAITLGGSEGRNVSHIRVTGLKVFGAKPVIPGSVGIVLQNVVNSDIDLDGVWFCSTAVQIKAVGSYTAYNRIRVATMRDCPTGWSIDVGAGDASWANVNHVHDSSYGYVGPEKAIAIDVSCKSRWEPCNWTFHCCQLESGNPLTLIRSQVGQWWTLRDCWLESPKGVTWDIGPHVTGKVYGYGYDPSTVKIPDSWK